MNHWEQFYLLASVRHLVPGCGTLATIFACLMKTFCIFLGKCPQVTMSPSLGTPTPFTVTCHQVSAQTLAAAPRRGQPVCRTCRSAPCPSLPPSHPLLSTSQCLASGVPSHPHSLVCHVPSCARNVYWTRRRCGSHAQHFTHVLFGKLSKSRSIMFVLILVLFVATCCQLSALSQCYGCCPTLTLSMDGV